MLDSKKDRRITVRLCSEDYDYLLAVAYMAGMDVSKYVRTLAQASVSAARLQEQKGAFKLEDIKAVLNDKL